MTVILPDNYHAKAALESRGVFCIPRDAALKQDIRAIRIGVLNIMPNAQSYEFNLLNPLGQSVLQIDPIWIRLKSHSYNSTDKDHLDNLYVSFDEAIKNKNLDGLILTGAPVEDIRFEQVKYWEELKEIFAYARQNIASTLGICWGGMAIAKFLGVDKIVYTKKLFGVFDTKNLDKNNPIMSNTDDYFWCPQSRHAGIPDEVLEIERDKGNINLLAHNSDAGYTIFETIDHRFVMHLGHPEYNSGRIIEEAKRDLNRDDVPPPTNYDINNPVNRWRSHRNEFFHSWIKYVYLTTEY